MAVSRLLLYLCVSTGLAALQDPLVAEDGVAGEWKDGPDTSWTTNSNDHPRKYRHGVTVKYFTFDDEEFLPPGTANQTYTHDLFNYLVFDNFNIFNSSEARQQGFITPMELDCAASKENALHKSPHSFTTPSVIRSNASALAALNLSDLFDVIAYSWKPLGSAAAAAAEYASLSMVPYKIRGDEKSSKEVAWAAWVTPDDGYFQLNTDVFGDHFATGVNRLEFEGKTRWGNPVDFCIDNLVLLFHEKEEGE